MVLLNILPCVCLITLNKRIYDVVQIKIINRVLMLNKRRVSMSTILYSKLTVSLSVLIETCVCYI